MQILMIINDPPYGTGWIYNSLRLAANLLTNHKESKLAVFLLGDSASGAKSGQQTPNGYDNIERMLVDVMRKGTRVRIGGTYMDARGLTEGDLIAKHCGARWMSLETSPWRPTGSSFSRVATKERRRRDLTRHIPIGVY